MENQGFIVKYRKTILILVGNLVAFFLLFSAKGQSPEGYIYGKVYTYNTTYQGQIRWGKEEAYWNDHFNAYKPRRQYEYIVKEKGEKKESFDWDDFWSIWENKKQNLTHEFTCQFGDIDVLIVQSRDVVKLQMKNGTELKLNNGSNDFGATVIVFDDELGKVKLSWSKIKKVDFMPTPKSLKSQGGGPLFGTVEVFRKEPLTGFIQWDHDERMGDDVLDGDSRDGDISIAFSKIASIKNDGDGSYVELKSGRKFYLRGSNDVNRQNRGIIVSIPEVGKIDIPWRDFKSVQFKEAKNTGPGYDSYSVPRGLYGTVYTYDDKVIKGQMLYDVDEKWEIETLEGKDDKILYKIPFRNIKKIKPKNYTYSAVELRNGERLILGDVRDVTSDNDGVLVFVKDQKEPTYIKWRDVVEVEFD